MSRCAHAQCAALRLPSLGAAAADTPREGAAARARDAPAPLRPLRLGGAAARLWHAVSAGAARIAASSASEAPHAELYGARRLVRRDQMGTGAAGSTAAGCGMLKPYSAAATPSAAPRGDAKSAGSGSAASAVIAVSAPGKPRPMGETGGLQKAVAQRGRVSSPNKRAWSGLQRAAGLVAGSCVRFGAYD